MNEQAFAEVLLNPHFFHHFDVHKNENIPITDFDKSIRKTSQCLF